MYNKIVNPKTGRKVSITGTIGKKILRNYIHKLRGGASLSNLPIQDDLIATIGLSDYSRPHESAYIPHNRKPLSKIERFQYWMGKEADRDWHPSQLHQAAFYGEVDAITALIKAGADVNAKDSEGNTALDIAKKRHITTLRQTGIDGDMEDTIQLLSSALDTQALSAFIWDNSSKLDNWINLANSKIKNYLHWMWLKSGEGKKQDEILGLPEKLVPKINNWTPAVYTATEFQLVNDKMLNYVLQHVEDIYSKLQPSVNTEYRVIKRVISDSSKVAYFGDFHSGLHSIIDSLTNLRNKHFFKSDTWELKDDHYIVFLGDLVDRGPYGVECMFLVYFLFIINNQTDYRVFILNGNHEDPSMYKKYGFKTEMDKQLSIASINKLESIMSNLPVALFLKGNGKERKWYQFCHGGVDKYQEYGNKIKDFLENKSINELSINDNPDNSGFMWSDFTIDYIFNGKKVSPERGSTQIYEYSAELTKEILDKNGIKAIISGHQDNTSFGFIPRPNHDISALLASNIVDNADYPGKLKSVRDFENSDSGSGEGHFDLDMNDVVATINSSATVSKYWVKKATYGILNIESDVSRVYWFDTCNSRHIVAFIDNKTLSNGGVGIVDHARITPGKLPDSCKSNLYTVPEKDRWWSADDV